MLNTINEFTSGMRKAFNNHKLLVITFHLSIGGVFAATGFDCLEPMAATWIYAPILAKTMSPDFGLGEWVSKRASLWFWISWILNITVLPILAWDIVLYPLDVNLLHPIRDHVGRFLGLGGQNGLMLVGDIVLWLLVIFVESRRRWRRQLMEYA